MNDSILDRPASLRELLVIEDVKRVADAFCSRENVAVRVFESGGDPLYIVEPEDDALAFLLENATGMSSLTQFVSALKKTHLHLEQWDVAIDPIAGMRFLCRPIENDLSTVGLLVLGPYRNSQLILDHDKSCRMGPSIVEGFNQRSGRLREVEDDKLRDHSDILCSAFDAMCHSGYRTLLASELHLESMNSSYLALEEAHRNLNAQHEDLLQANARLRELDELKSNFLATVSHELRTPLTSVIGYSEMLLEELAGPINEEQGEYLRTIMERGLTLLDMIGSILDISSIERGAIQLDRENVDIAQLVENALSNVRPQARKKEIGLRTQIESALPLVALDRHKTRQSLINLLGNAVKFTPKGGVIQISVHRCTMGMTEHLKLPIEAIRFAVQDNGIGIPQDKLDRVIEAFYQVDNSATRKYGGAGLGLSIVKNFVDAHGGTLDIQSKPGEGSIFAFTVPVPEPKRDGGTGR